jgi:hypothetical protein
MAAAAAATLEVKPFKSIINIRLPSEHDAQIVMAVLDVDEELQPERMSRVYSVHGETLQV